MKKRMQMISCITAAMLISLTAAGCSQKDNSAAETADVQTEAQTSEPQISETKPEDGDQIHLKWALWSADSQPYWQPIADAYMEQNPNVTIELVDLGVTDYVTALSTQMAGDERPYDVVAIKDLAQYTSMIQKGLLKPLDESKIDADLYNGNLDLYKWEGQCYTLPLRSDFYAIFYNKDLFDAAGVTYPTNDMTFEEFDEIARKMTNTTFGSEVYGVHYHPAWSQLYNGFGILEGRHNVMDGNYEYMTPADEMVLKQQEDGVCMDYATAKTSGVNYLAAFGAADVAMFPSGYWCVGT